MTLDAAEINQVIELASRVSAETARNLVRGTGGAMLPLPVTRLGTVGGTVNAGGEVSVRADGDSNAVPAINATGEVLEPGDRVVIDWRPVAAVYVTHKLTRASRGNWTPQIAGASAVSTSSTSSGHYTRHGHKVTVSGVWTRGASSSVGTAGQITGLPFPVITDGDTHPAIFHCYVYDASIPRFYDAKWIVAEGQTSGQIWVPFAFATPTYMVLSPIVDATNPMAWATGDQIFVHGTYDTDAA
jgi:hypothetical protein